MYPVQAIAQKAYELVANAPDRTMIGARLGALLKLAFPEFSPVQYRTRNLRQFVKAHVPVLSERPHTGVDVLFIASDEEPIVAGLTSVVTPNAKPRPAFVRLPMSLFNWRVFSNPSNPSTLILNTETKELQAVESGVEIAAPWVILPRPTSDRHHEIATDFVASLAEPSKSALGSVLQDPYWYRHFSPVAKREGVASEWVSFRLRRLVEDFEGELIKFGLPEDSLRQSPMRISKPGEQETLRVAQEMRVEEAGVRDLILRVIHQLPMEELRSLRLPIGIVLDAIEKK